jgi:hypothetical protein
MKNTITVNQLIAELKFYKKNYGNTLVCYEDQWSEGALPMPINGVCLRTINDKELVCLAQSPHNTVYLMSENC